MIIPSKEDLFKFYYTENKSPNEISKIYFVSRPTILKWLNIYNIQIRNHEEASKIVSNNQIGKKRYNKQDAHNKLSNYDWLYRKRIILKKSKEDIANECGCSTTLVNKYIKLYNIKKIKYNESNNKNLLDKDLLKNLYNKDNTLEDIASTIGSSKSTVSVFFKKYNIETKEPNYYDRRFQRISKPHEEIINFIKSIYDGEIRINDRQLVGIELDIYIPEKNFAIEFNGLFYHSEAAGKDQYYHLNKTLKCEEKGIFLFHIFEDSWNNNKEVILSMIRNKLGLNLYKEYARKLIIKDVSKEDRRLFYNINHLQGQDQSSFAYGLYKENVLICCISFSGSRKGSNHDWELVRFASLINTNVVGGFSRLLCHFRKNHQGSIVSYCDKCYSDGGIYRNNGFILEKKGRPDYYYLDKSYSRRLRKENFRKEHLKKNYNADISKTEKEIMYELGYIRIWNCGIDRYVLYN